MLFDRNQTDFLSDYHKDVFAFGVRMVPLDISLRNVSDENDRKEFTVFHEFILRVYYDMWENPGAYNGTGPFRFIYDLCEIIDVSGYDGKSPYIPDIQPANNKIKNNVMFIKPDIYARHGIHFDKVNSKMISEKYEKFFPTFFTLYNAALKKKLNVMAYVSSCDFRVLQKGFAPTFEDLVRPLPDNIGNHLTDIHNYALSKNIKVEKSKYHDRIRYKYKNCPRILVIEPNRINIYFKYGDLERVGTDEKLIRFLDKISQHENSEALIEYCLKGHLPYCNWCRKSTKNPRCGIWWELFEKRRMVCKNSCISSKNTKGDDNKIDSQTVVLLKQFLDVCLEMADV